MTNRIRLKRAIAAVTVGVLAASTLAATADDSQSVAAHLGSLYPNTPFRDVKPAPVAGLYEVTMGQNIAYTDASGQYFLFGHLFDMQNQVDLTEQTQAQGYKTQFPAQFLDHAIKTVHGNGRRVVAIFSDPDCPYCRAIEKELQRVDNVTIYTFLYPLESIHPGATNKSIRIQCATDPAQAWRDWMTSNRLPPLVACHHPINDNLVLGSWLGVTGTPTLIAEDGRMLPGAVSSTQLEAWLNAGQRVPSAGDQDSAAASAPAQGVAQ
ncbi:DsbC family protein [Burkholderia ubonensis]|uniref:DsbC family protein n=1 Tax=Burkholderia ubonensis TaxID=101571 RepID=UPI000A65133E|nr:DsbC family protein [Burkholderia ubonensis]